jgi:hypothetical protein
MKISEFCQEMAVNTENAGVLPNGSGLCAVFGGGSMCGLISEWQADTLIRAMWNMFDPNRSKIFIWKRGQVEPRIIALQLLAEHFAELGL